jgi:hypothetical protein
MLRQNDGWQPLAVFSETVGAPYPPTPHGVARSTLYVLRVETRASAAIVVLPLHVGNLPISAPYSYPTGKTSNSTRLAARQRWQNWTTPTGRS